MRQVSSVTFQPVGYAEVKRIYVRGQVVGEHEIRATSAGLDPGTQVITVTSQ